MQLLNIIFLRVESLIVIVVTDFKCESMWKEPWVYRWYNNIGWSLIKTDLFILC